MSHLAPLVRRAPERPGPARLAAVGAVPAHALESAPPLPGLAADLRLFATGWAGGLVFLGTMLA